MSCKGSPWHVGQRRVVGLLGRNGMGKTTLIRSIIGFTPPRQGQVRFKDQDITARRTLMTNPDLLLIDEPTEGLAPLLVREGQRAIADLKAQGLSILLVEQHVSLALQVAEYVHVLSRGRLVHSSAPVALWHNQEVQARYLGM